MSVTIDDEVVAAEAMGLQTVGHVLSHLRKDNRLVVQLLIDGRVPDLDRIGVVRQALLCNHTVFIETAEPREMALEVLAEVEHQLAEADRLKNEAVDLLAANSVQKAMEKLSGCFSTWFNAHESIRKTAQLLRISVESIRVGGISLGEFLVEFVAHLRDMKSALENRDFVTLADILTYEATDSSAKWTTALKSVRETVQVRLA